MFLSLNLINKYFNHSFLIDDIVNSLINIGIEVENYYRIYRDYSKIRVGKVVFKEKHPNADKLYVCKVDFKDEVLQILTADETIQINDIVLVALKGAVLNIDNNKIVIDVRKMKGLESYGMMLATKELGWDNVKAIGDKVAKFNFDKNFIDNIGKYLTELIPNEDYIIEIKTFANRPDYLGFYHILKELSIKLNINLKELSFFEDFKLDNEYQFDIELLTDKCRVYTGAIVENIKILPSPVEFQILLNNVNLKPINNVVDITNFVMYELANPLHAFDFNFVKQKIIVRNANNDEVLNALDDKDYILSNEDVIISDVDNKVLALGGIIGSRNYSIFDNTNIILLESANFDPISIRRTSKKLGIFTNSSKRFERDLPIYYSILVYKRALFFIKKFIPQSNIKFVLSKVHQDLGDLNKALSPKLVNFDINKVRKYLGFQELQVDKVKEIFNKLEFELDILDDSNIIVKTYRKDINHWWDLAEEIARFQGYEFFKNKALNKEININYFNVGKQFSLKLEQDFKNAFINNNFIYVIGYSLLNSEYLKLFDSKYLSLLNPMSGEYNAYRNYVLASTLLIADYNYKQGYKNLKIFEIGHSYLDYEKKELAAVIINNNINFLFKDLKNYLIFNFQILKNIIYSVLNSYNIYKDLIEFKKSSYNFLEKSYDIYVFNNKIGFIGVVNYLVNEYIKDGELPPFTIAFTINLSELEKIIQNYSNFNFESKSLINNIQNFQLVELPLIYRDFSVIIKDNFFLDNILFNLKIELLDLENQFNSDNIKFKIIDFYLLDSYKDLNSYTFRVVLKPFENISSNYLNEFFENYLSNLDRKYSIKRR
ncbi:MAG: phenylalanine--tRNA ligase subunit beta [bacterium]